MAGKGKGNVSAKQGSIQGNHYLSAVADLQFRLSAHQRIWSPPTDLFETRAALVVKVEAPGMREDDFSITYSQGLLRVHGRRHEPAEKIEYHRMEICYGEFLSEVTIHKNIEKEQIEASYAEGFLTVTLPKVQPRKITVQG